MIAKLLFNERAFLYQYYTHFDRRYLFNRYIIIYRGTTERLNEINDTMFEFNITLVTFELF